MILHVLNHVWSVFGALVFLALSSSCSSLLYHPDSIIYYSPEKLGYQYTEHTLINQAGSKLIAWRIQAKNKPNRGVILQFHGNAENLSSHYTSLLWMTNLGYELIAFDYQGYGGSEGSPSPEGTVEDGIASYNFATAALVEQKKMWRPPLVSPKLIVYGQSLGGAIVPAVLEKIKPQPDAVVLDSTFLSYKHIGYVTLKQRWVTWPFSPLAFLFLSDGAISKNYLTSNTHPPLLIGYSKNDQVVPASEGLRLWEYATHPKTQAVWSGKTKEENSNEHLDQYYGTGGGENRQKLLNFLKAL